MEIPTETRYSYDSYLGAKPLLTTPFPSRGNIIRFHASDGFGVVQFADSPGSLPASNVRTAAFPLPKERFIQLVVLLYSLCAQKCCPTSHTASHENSRVLPGKCSATKATRLETAVASPLMYIGGHCNLARVCVFSHLQAGLL